MAATKRRAKGKCLRGLWASERGGVAMYLALAMLFIMPMMAGAISVSQVYTLNTELQQAADAAALAAATELDGTEAGCAEAIAAAQDAVQNYQSFANDGGGAEANIGSIMLLEALPPAPLTPLERLGVPGRYADLEAKKCADVRYVRVVTELRGQVSYPMRAYLIMTGPYLDLTDADSDADARMVTASAAVAGHVTVACKTMPIMMCNPVELDTAKNCGDPSILDGANVDPNDPNNLNFAQFFNNNPKWRRRMFRIKWIGPGAQFSPGTFGLLEPFFSDKKSTPGIIEELGMEDPPICVTLDSPLREIKPGQAAAIVNGLNTRFDFYRGPAKKYSKAPNYRPAPNVTKGLLPGSKGGKGNKCRPTGTCDDPSSPMFEKCSKLPRDRCFKEGADMTDCYTPSLDFSDPQIDPRIGDGAWPMDDYFRINHPDEYDEYFVDDSGDPVSSDEDVAELKEFLEEIRDSVPKEKYVDDLPVDIDNPPSRYSTYSWEIANDEVPGEDTMINDTPVEEGKRPSKPDQCSDEGPGPDARRNIFIAVVNCCAQSESLGGRSRVYIDYFLEAFLTEVADPTGQLGKDDKGAIYVEPVQVVPPGGDQVILRDYVQLY